MTTTALDDRLVPLALNLVTKYGRDADFTVLASQTPSPSTGTVVDGAATVYTRKITPPEPYATRYIDGDLIQEGDAKTYVAAKDIGFLPANGMRLKIGAFDWWTIVRVNAISTGFLVALYELQVRK